MQSVQRLWIIVKLINIEMFRCFGVPYQNLAVQESCLAVHPSLSVLSSISHCEDLTHAHVKASDCMSKLCSQIANNYRWRRLESNGTHTCHADYPWEDTSPHSPKNGPGIPESWYPVCVVYEVGCGPIDSLLYEALGQESS